MAEWQVGLVVSVAALCLAVAAAERVREHADYYPERPGGSAVGRAIEPAPFDARRLGPERGRPTKCNLYRLDARVS